MSTGAGIRAVLLDGDGVVQLPDASWLKDIEAWCGDRSLVDAFLHDVFEAERPALVGQADFRANLMETLRQWKATVPVDDALLVWHKIQASTAALDLVAELRSHGRTVALASNQQRHRAT